MSMKICAVLSALVCVLALAGPGTADVVPLTLVGSDQWDSDTTFGRLLYAGEYPTTPYTFTLAPYTGTQPLEKVVLRMKVILTDGISAVENTSQLVTSPNTNVAIDAALAFGPTFAVPRLDHLPEAITPFTFADTQSNTQNLDTFLLHGGPGFPTGATPVPDAITYFTESDSVLAVVNGLNFDPAGDEFDAATYDLNFFRDNPDLRFSFSSTSLASHTGSSQNKAYAMPPAYYIEAEVLYYTPEPMTMGLLAVGSLTLLARRRRK